MPSEEVMQRQEEFFEALVDSKGDIESAQKTARVPRRTFFLWLREDEFFSKRFDEYRLLLSADIENEAVKRVNSPEGQRGSDALLTTMLKGLKRERYGEESKNQGIQQVIYVSGLREIPRVGVKDVADNDEITGRRGELKPGNRVPDEAGPPGDPDRNIPGSSRVNETGDESAEWRSVKGA